MSINVLPATSIPFDQFLDTFNRAYADYLVPLHLDATAMQSLIARDTIDMEASRVLLVDDETVGVGMLAVQGREGWIGGLGVLPAYRARGYGRLLMNELLSQVHQRGLDLVRLEVIDGNAAAYRLYLDLGFTVLRQLFVLECTDFSGSTDTRQVRSLEATEALLNYPALHQTRAPWQRRRAALQHLEGSMEGLGVYDADEGQLLACGLGWFNAELIRWMELAGSRQELRQIVAYAHQKFPTATGSFINVGEDHPFLDSLYGMGYKVTLTQLEMEYRPS